MKMEKSLMTKFSGEELDGAMNEMGVVLCKKSREFGHLI